MSESEFVLPEVLRNRAPAVGLVLGSGLGGFVDSLSDATGVSAADIGGLPVAGVPGHAGELQVGALGGVEVAVARGRVHLYEGWSAHEVAAPVRLLAQLGVRTLVLTNAAGIVNPDLQPGRWMLIADHLNLAGRSPLTGGARFVDQTEVYSPTLRERLKAESATRGPAGLTEGIYAWVAGPEYETPAEIRMIRALGADAVGMSTVPEAIQARALGMRVVGLSCLTNFGAGLAGRPLDHREVVDTGHRAAAELHALLEGAVPAMGAS